MIVYKRYLFGIIPIPYTEVFFAKRTEEINAIIGSSPIVMLHQCAPEIASDYRAMSFYIKPFYTTVIDLSQDIDTIWRNFKKKSCRYEIKKAEKIDHKTIVNRWDLQTYKFIQNFRRRMGLPLISQKSF